MRKAIGWMAVMAIAAVAVASRPCMGQQRSSPLDDPGFFPITVWVQNPANAERYKAAGINTYVALWNGPTAEQLSQLKRAGMYVVADQNEAALASPDNDIIIAWMHGDEPDNAQALPNGEGWGPPVEPEKIVADYHEIKKRDPSRPVLLNLGQGVAWDGWIGRGVRTNHPEDYPQYVKGADLVSFDIYPAVHDHPDVAGKLEFVAHGVQRLKEWAGPQRTVWNCIEASRISNTKTKPTPHQVRAEVWMSLIHGSKGLIYFVHQFEPRFIEASLLEDERLLAAVTAINRQIIELAPVLNSQTVEGEVNVTLAADSAPVAAMVKKHDGATYLFTVGMRNESAKATFTLKEKGPRTATVIGERRTIVIDEEGAFADTFEAYGVHLYRIE